MTRDSYLALEDKALAALARAVEPVDTSLEVRAVCGAVAGLTFAVLAVADRLDTLIDCAFDRRVPMRFSVVEDEPDEPAHADEGESEERS